MLDRKYELSVRHDFITFPRAYCTVESSNDDGVVIGVRYTRTYDVLHILSFFISNVKTCSIWETRLGTDVG